MLHYDRIAISERIDVDQVSSSKECNVCHYWYFLDEGFKFQPDVCNGCHDVLKSINLDNIYDVDIDNVLVSKISSGEKN